MNILVRGLPWGVYATHGVGVILVCAGAVGAGNGLTQSGYLGALALFAGVFISTAALHVADGWQR